MHSVTLQKSLVMVGVFALLTHIFVGVSVAWDQDTASDMSRAILWNEVLKLRTESASSSNPNVTFGDIISSPNSPTTKVTDLPNLQTINSLLDPTPSEIWLTRHGAIELGSKIGETGIPHKFDPPAQLSLKSTIFETLTRPASPIYRLSPLPESNIGNAGRSAFPQLQLRLYTGSDIHILQMQQGIVKTINEFRTRYPY
jgi:hypothetical protein